MQSSNLGTLTQELMATVLPVTTEDISQIMKATGWKSTGASMLVAAVWKKAVSGDMNAVKAIREMNGEVENADAGFDLSQMSDAMLYRIAAGEESLTGAVKEINGADGFNGADRVNGVNEATDIGVSGVSGIAGNNISEMNGQTGNPVSNIKSEPDPVNGNHTEDPAPKKKYYEVPW